MRRLGIFSFFDRDGIVGDYIQFLLNDLAPNLELLVIVINGTINGEGYRILQRYTERILIRENVGYDAGAYKDAMLDYIGIKTIRDYDQLILCNDTFYGPFVPFSKIFQEMEKPNIDFWGINYIKDNVANYIQSYFLVINARIIKSGDLFEFFERWIDAKTTKIQDVYVNFEMSMSDYLHEKGYHFDTYTRKNNCSIYTSSNFSIKKYGFPFMKKICFSLKCYRENNVMDALKYINSYTNYDIGLILQEANRIYNFPFSKEEIIEYSVESPHEYQIPTAKECRKEIEAFLKENQEIYIYGAGLIAQVIARLYFSFLQNVKGFIVSNDQNIYDKELVGLRIQHFSEIEPTKISVLVALNTENTKSVISNLDNCKSVLSLWDI